MQVQRWARGRRRLQVQRWVRGRRRLQVQRWVRGQAAPLRWIYYYVALKQHIPRQTFVLALHDLDHRLVWAWVLGVHLRTRALTHPQTAQGPWGAREPGVPPRGPRGNLALTHPNQTKLPPIFPLLPSILPLRDTQTMRHFDFPRDLEHRSTAKGAAPYGS